MVAKVRELGATVIACAVAVACSAVPASGEQSWRWDSFEREWEYKMGDIEYEYDPDSGEFEVERDRGWAPDEEIAEYEWNGTQGTEPRPLREGTVPKPPTVVPYVYYDWDYDYEWDDYAEDGWDWEPLQREWEYEADGREYEYEPRTREFRVERERAFLPDEVVREYTWDRPFGERPAPIREGRVPAPPMREPYIEDYGYDRPDYTRYGGERYTLDLGDDEDRDVRGVRGWEWEPMQREWEYEAGSGYEFEYEPRTGIFRVERERPPLPDEVIAEYRWTGEPNKAPRPVREGRVPQPPTYEPARVQDQYGWYDDAWRGYDRDVTRDVTRDTDRRAIRDTDTDDEWDWEPLQGEWEYEAGEYEYEYEPDADRFRVERDRGFMPDQTIAEYNWRPGQPIPEHLRQGRIPAPPTENPRDQDEKR